MALDYGFSGVDNPDQTPVPIPVVASVPVEHTEKLDLIIEKIDALKNAMSNSSTIDSIKYAENIKQLEAIIIPLLNNLLKTAGQPYIYWPDRGPLIERQIQAVLRITRGDVPS